MFIISIWSLAEFVTRFNFWSKKNHIYFELFATTSYLNNLISVQPPRSTRSSSVVTLSRPPTISSLKITDRSFRYASPRLWNQLPDSFRQPRQSCLDSPPHSLVSSSLLSSPLSSPITPSLFHISSKPTFSTNLPTLDFFCLPDCFHDNGTGPDLSCTSFYFLFHILIFCLFRVVD